MKSFEDDERSLHAPSFNPADVDREFIPYLERINSKPFAASIQCCVGHLKYEFPSDAPANHTGHWGYLQLLMTGPSAVWLCQEVHGSGWLVLPLSKMWPDKNGKKAGKMPTYTSKCNFIIAFAWDASAWPTPVDEICSLLDRYHAAEPDEPPHLVKFDIPKEKGKNKRPDLRQRKKRRRP